MINLGDGPFRPEQCRREILNELHLANVTNIVTEEKEEEVIDPTCEAGVLANYGVMIPYMEKRFLKETRFDISAKLRGWTLRRSWTYWVVRTGDEKALIGTEDATTLHKEHGKDLRVAGHCGCPAPEPPWLFYKSRVDATILKNEVVITLDGNFHSVLPKHAPNVSWMTTFEKLDKAHPGRHLGMALYHIDTQEAFNVFCAYLIRRGAAIDQAERAFREERARTDDWYAKFTPEIDGYIRQWQKERGA